MNFLSSQESKEPFIEYMHQAALKEKIWMDCFNGCEDHIHCLISLGKDQNIHEVVQRLQTISCEWIHDKECNDKEFEWKHDYWAVSVGESRLDGIRSQIQNQDKHHNSVSFEEELDVFLNEFDNAWIQNHDIR